MIHGSRLRLRSPEQADLPLFVSWLNDPEVRHNLAAYWPISMAREERWFAELASRPAQEQPLVIEIQQAQEWTAIGNCGFHHIDWVHRNAEVGIMIGEKAHWNQGYGTEAMQLLQQIGFETLNLHRIYLRAYERNQAGLRAYEKAGFQLEGRQRHAQYDEGVYSDVLMMSILRPEYDALKGSSK
ncbi:MAG: GNAT family N-acetyltransferase [Anaerolineales bacterium]|nr:MAG: GNAT family N-acetyltransferase [Anaerolineales bacterium]